MCTKKASKIFCTKSAHTMLVKLPPDWVRSLKHKFPYSQRSVSNDVTLLRTDIFCDNNIKLSVRCFLNICCSRHTHYATPMCLNRSKIQIVRIGGASYGTLCIKTCNRGEKGSTLLQINVRDVIYIPTYVDHMPHVRIKTGSYSKKGEP